MQIGTVDLNKLQGINDKFFGLTKEYVGILVNNSRLQEEGEAQQEKASEKLKALREEDEGPGPRGARPRPLSSVSGRRSPPSNPRSTAVIHVPGFRAGDVARPGSGNAWLGFCVAQR